MRIVVESEVIWDGSQWTLKIGNEENGRLYGRGHKIEQAIERLLEDAVNLGTVINLDKFILDKIAEQ
jgi:hypothetical protein